MIVKTNWTISVLLFFFFLSWWIPYKKKNLGCSNNNYASRTSCKKCNLSREEAAVPALALPGMSLLPTYAHYLSRQQQGLKTGLGSPSGSHMQSAAMSAGLGWMYGAQAGSYGLHSPTSANPGSNNWGFGGTGSGQFLGLPKDWRSGDWMCVCGFHNYSSRDQVYTISSFCILLLLYYCLSK